MRTPSAGTAKFFIARVTLGLLVVLVGLASVAWAARHVASGHRAVSNGRFTLRVAPARRVVAPGAASRFEIFVSRAHPRRGRPGRAFTGAVRLRVSGLPRGSTASFSVNPARRASLLRVATSRRTPVGTYRLVVRGRSHGHRVTASLALVVSWATHQPKLTGSDQPKITGSVTGFLAPGVSLPLNLTLHNVTGSLMQVTQITVSLRAVSAPHADAAHPCTAADFAITQFSGAYGFSLPTAHLATLSGEGVPPAHWPSVGMLDRSVNQDGCKGAVLTFGYAARVVWGGP